METRYAPAARTPDDIIFELFGLVNKVPFVQELLDKSTDLMLILNENRQVVFTNRLFLDFIGVTDINQVLGKRPGEAVRCIHAEDLSGCGTTEFCITCGAVNAILGSQTSGTEVREECLLSVKGGVSVELDVIARPFDYHGRRFTFFTAKDISESKRKSALEKIFFHDILNLASGIYSVIDLFKDGTIDDLPEEMLDMLHKSSFDMVKEINDYRTLILAERGELKAMPKTLNAGTMLKDVAEIYSAAGTGRGVRIQVREDSCSCDMKTDPSLLKRILINMLKNAMEASGRGDKVTVWCEAGDKDIVFCVNNPAVMTEDVKTQVFRRTFTTKATGSGLGTYSIKLLGENFLKGRVNFTSEEGEGTTFRVALPYVI